MAAPSETIFKHNGAFNKNLSSTMIEKIKLDPQQMMFKRFDFNQRLNDQG